MNRTLVLIQGYAKAQATIERHWPYYLKSGCDLVGIDREDSKVNWPTERLIGKASIGKSGYPPQGGLPEFLIDTFNMCLESPALTEYSDYLVIEHDSIFTGPVPKHPGGFVAFQGANGGPPWHANVCLHCPWWGDRHTAMRIVSAGDKLIKAGLREGAFPDRFLGLLVELFDIPWTPANTFSVNAIDRPSYVEAARLAITDGAWHIHGVKTAAQLEAVTKGLVSL